MLTTLNFVFKMVFDDDEDMFPKVLTITVVLLDVSMATFLLYLSKNSF